MSHVVCTGSLKAHIDRTQAARLYAGNVEYGYFVREMEARCEAGGLAAGQDADNLITFASSLPEEQLRSVLCRDVNQKFSGCLCVDVRQLNLSHHHSFVFLTPHGINTRIMGIIGHKAQPCRFPEQVIRLLRGCQNRQCPQSMLLSFGQPRSCEYTMLRFLLHMLLAHLSTLSIVPTNTFMLFVALLNPPRYKCRAASKVRTRQAWHAAVRHTGLLFQLPVPASVGAAPTSFTADSHFVSASAQDPHSPESSRAEADDAGGSAALELPYPQLAQTVSSANFAPAAHLAEHYSPPGGLSA